MAISNYSELKTAIAAWLHRSDLDDRLPEFIALAETRINGDVMGRAMDTRTNLTATASSRFVTLPTDMLEMRRLTLLDEPYEALEYKSPDQLTQDDAYQTDTGRPEFFTIVGSQIELSPTPDSAYSLEILYRQRVPALSDAAPTNWLLTANPNVYLFASLLQGGVWTQDEARFPIWEAKYREAIAAVNTVDWYSGSSLRVRSA